MRKYNVAFSYSNTTDDGADFYSAIINSWIIDEEGNQTDFKTDVKPNLTLNEIKELIWQS